MALFVTPGQLKRKAEFYREMAALLGAGIPAMQALEAVQRRASSALRPALREAIGHIQQGATFTDALSRSPGCLTDFEVALLRAGEHSGRMVESCRSLAEHHRERAGLVEGFFLKLAYPAVLLHLALVIFPTGSLVALVLQGEVEAFLRQKLLVLGPLYGGALLLAVALSRQRASGWRAAMELTLGLVPVLGVARRELALARLAEALEALISAGITVIEAWELAADASGSPALRRAVHAWRDRIQSGELPSDLVRESGAFTDLFANLYFTGETSGQLDSELRHLRDYYRESGTRKLGLFALGAALALTLGVMLTIAVSVILFYSNYFRDLFQQVNF